MLALGMHMSSTTFSKVSLWKRAVILHMQCLLNVTLLGVWLLGTVILTGLLLTICPGQKGHRSNEGQDTKWSF